MSAAVEGVLKLTIGLLSKKVCTYVASRLQNGSLTEMAFRRLIISELEDIKSKLDADAHKELGAGISDLNQGVTRLSISFKDSVDSPIPSPSQYPNTAHTQETTEPSNDPVSFGHVFNLAHTMVKLKTIANERYQLAQESFKNAAKNAGLAFHNPVLSLEDRILASKVRIASGILEHIRDPDLAASDCLQYLKELNALHSIYEILNVQNHGGLKGFFNRDRRAEIVQSVITINFFLLDFISKCTTTGNSFNIFDWPLIECDTKAYHPIYYDEDSVTNERKTTPPWCIKIRSLLRCRCRSAVNSKGDILLCPLTAKSLTKLDRATGELQHLEIPSPQDRLEEEIITCNYLTVDEDDTVYLLTRYSQSSDYTLTVFETNGNIVYHTVEFLKRKDCHCFEVSKDKRLVFCCEFEQNESKFLYICDSNCQLTNSFPVCIPDNQDVKDISSSNFNEVILVATKKNNSSTTILLYVYTIDGQQKESVKLRLPVGSASSRSYTVRYNYLRNNFVCFGSTMMGDRYQYLQFDSYSGDLQSSCDLNVKHLGFITPNLSSHPKGNVALICQNGALFIRSQISSAELTFYSFQTS